MALECSHCGAPRTTRAAACPFCAVLYSEAAPPGAPPDKGDGPKGVLEALDAGNKIEAVRLYREATGHGLRDALKAVENIERERKCPDLARRGAGGDI
jgi:ribosomal protein L7/L12